MFKREYIMNKPELRRIEDFIKTLEEKELRYLNRLIIERVKLISQARSTNAMSKFNIGEQVSFTDPHGRHHTGQIVRLNKKTVSIKTSEGENWNVAPGFLQ